jgi:hypothetical protein
MGKWMRRGEDDGMYEYRVTGCGWRGADGVRIGECM